ncbi:MAG: MotA/TolQ/ExbB proton channel family protein [Planctomycetota bacterium]
MGLATVTRSPRTPADVSWTACRRWLAALLVAAAAGLTPTACLAQGEGEAAAPPAADNAAPAGDNATADATQTKSLLGWAADALGYFYGPVFLALSFTLLALFVMNLLQATRGNVIPADLVEGFQEQLDSKQWTAALEVAEADDSFLGKVLSAGLTKLKNKGNYSQAIEAMQEVGEEENMKLEHRLSYMALIGTISPMIGLMGTVQGMIGAFQTISTTSTGAPSATDLAADISTALFTTLAGLIVAIPAIAAYNILRNRIARLVLEVGIVSEGLMSRFENAGTK